MTDQFSGRIISPCVWNWEDKDTGSFSRSRGLILSGAGVRSKSTLWKFIT